MRCRINLSLFISFPSSLLLLARGVDEISTPTQCNADSRTLLILLPLPLTSCAPFAPSFPLDASHPILPWSPASVLLSVNLSLMLMSWHVSSPCFLHLSSRSCLAAPPVPLSTLPPPSIPSLTLLFPVFNPLTCTFPAYIFFSSCTYISGISLQGGKII